MLNRIRENIEPILLKIGKIFSHLRISPTGWSIIGLIVGVIAAMVYAEIINGGIVLGGILLLVMGFFDIIDGAVAKATNSVSLKGAFIDSNADRISEILVFIGIFQSELVNPNIILLALSGSLMVSYVRAKSEAMNIHVAGLGVGERAERIIVLALFSIGGEIQLGMMILTILTIVTVIQRITYVILTLKK